jgi:uncharacterized protein YggE
MKTLLLGLVLLLPAAASASVDRQVSVSGSCTRFVVADRGAIVLTAQFVEQTVEAATSKATAAYDRAAAAVRKLGLESLDLRTVEYSVTEDREWEKNRQVFKGYRARMGLRVATSSVQRMGEVMSVASREGMSDVGSLSTYVSDERRRHEELECLNDAAADARARASRLAEALGARLGEIVTISQQAEGEPTLRIAPQNFAANAALGASAAPPSVEAGQQEIRVGIGATFSLK